MYYTLCISYRGPDKSSKQKENLKPSESVVRNYDVAKFILYIIITSKDNKQASKNAEKSFKEAYFYI